ncbi:MULTISPECIES: alkane 1-monooxygenase [unclassified Pseudoalteromonas]|uniref:alkane 1-monooxygenase n=1 Tax=unclassified Pseudoalteromonas TaxID=194690 RepID=UPI0030147C2F
MIKYIRFMAMAFVFSPAMILLLIHGSSLAIFLPMSVIVLQVVLDNLLPKYTAKPAYQHKWFLDFLLFVQVPLTMVGLFVLMWQIAPGDLFGFGAWIEQNTSLKVLESHAAFTLKDGLLSAMACGFYFSVNTLIGHELTHRLEKPTSMFFGKLALALVGDSQFSISHVYAHHKNVATPLDAATARRGENLYAFFIRSSLGQYKESWEFETNRLRRLKKNPYGLSNQVISGLLLTSIFALCCYFLSGFNGLICYLIFIFVAKFLFESVNYIEHYGLVRVPGEKVEPRHSWDCRNVMSTFNYLNLTRHSDHHANARKPYWDLEIQPTAADLPLGYMASILLSTIPPIWHRVSVPMLLDWDQRFATKAEKKLALEANAKSGLPELINSHSLYLEPGNES